MKYIVLVPDGAADRPVESHGGITPLEAARIPNMDFLAKQGLTGTAVNIPEGMPAGSDVANYSILGYDPSQYYTGRGPLEAASMGLELAPGDVAFRCNLVTEENGILLDFSAGHIPSREAKEIIDFLQERLGDERTSFHSGVGYRHLLVLKGEEFLQSDCIPPHDVVGKRVEDILPRAKGAQRLKSLISDSKHLLEDHATNSGRVERGLRPANMIWPWGQGKPPRLPSISDRYSLQGAIITAVDLIKGLGIHAGLEVINVPGATGYYDTDYEAKALYAVKSLYDKDLVYIHVEAPDEAGHEGNWEAKVEALENFDKRIVGNLLNEISRITEDFVILLVPDHPTPIEIRTHVPDAVPFAIYSLDGVPDAGMSFSERGAKGGLYQEFPGWQLLDLCIHGSAEP
jgi:2,3-bisphosphoglycerate-independent phosphoglycerate mutase